MNKAILYQEQGERRISLQGERWNKAIFLVRRRQISRSKRKMRRAILLEREKVKTKYEDGNPFKEKAKRKSKEI